MVVERNWDVAPGPVLRSTRAEIMSLVPRWAALHTEMCSDNPFIHPAWCTAWLDCYEPEHPRVLTDLDTAGRIRALAAFTAAGPARRQLLTLGASLADFGVPLVPRGPDGIDALVGLLTAHRSRWDSVLLTGTDDHMAQALIAVQPRSGVAFRIVASDVCPRVDVPSFDAWTAALPRGRWKRLAAARRRMQTQPGFSRALIEDRDEIEAAVRSFDALRLQSWWQRGRLRELAPGVRSARHRRLLLLAARRMAEHDAASVIELRIDDRVVASSLLFWTHGSVLVALKATDTRMSTSLSPGLVLDLHTIELAAQRGIRQVDFGRGDEPYKLILGARPHATHHLIATRPGARLPLVRAGLHHHASEAVYRWRIRRAP